VELEAAASAAVRFVLPRYALNESIAGHSQNGDGAEHFMRNLYF
jgi:hypothetical protein